MGYCAESYKTSSVLASPSRLLNGDAHHVSQIVLPREIAGVRISNSTLADEILEASRDNLLERAA